MQEVVLHNSCRSALGPTRRCHLILDGNCKKQFILPARLLAPSKLGGLQAIKYSLKLGFGPHFLSKIHSLSPPTIPLHYHW